MKASRTVKELAEFVGGRIDGDGSGIITGAASLNEAGEGDISFLANDRYGKELSVTRASAIVVGEETPSCPSTLIRCQDPYYAFTQILVLLYGYRKHEKVGISAKAGVADSARIGDNVDIYDFVSIAPEVAIGDNTKIYPSSSVGRGSTIGRDCLIYPNVTIYDGCTIGDRVTIHAGSVIGQDGFGYASHNGAHYKIPQIGGVIIEDDVEIGANCTIDRGTLDMTVIGRGTKMSNLIAIGHGTKVGPNCLMVAQVGVAGSVKIGKGCVFGGQVGVAGHITIGDSVRIGGKAGVSNDVESGQAILGTPARPLTQAKRSMILITQLPDIRRRLLDLERRLKKK